MTGFIGTPQAFTGTVVRLEPLTEDHIPALWDIGRDESIWRYMPFTVRSRDELAGLVRAVMAWPDRDYGRGYAVRRLDSGDLVGSTTYLNADGPHRRVEIGATWVAPAHQRTSVNTETKLLLLTNAFERMECIRVEFKTDSLNQRSRDALTRIGATEEGTLRNHMIMPDGRFRHSTYFSIVADEWPTLRHNLEARLAHNQ